MAHQQPSSCCSKKETAFVYEYIDPVCGMQVTETSQYYFDYLSIRYLFCSAGCQQKFSLQPENFLKQDNVQPTVSSCCVKEKQQKQSSCGEGESEQKIEPVKASSCCAPKPMEQKLSSCCDSKQDVPPVKEETKQSSCCGGGQQHTHAKEGGAN